MDDLRSQIAALASRHGLSASAADKLVALVGLVDWGETNFLPKPDREAGSHNGLGPTEASIAAAVLDESLAGLELETVRQARRVADIGSGAGVPGLVLAVALPAARITLIEAKPERCEFLREAITELELTHTEVMQGQVQSWAEGMGSCDLVTLRKVGRPVKVFGWVEPLLGPGGAFLRYETRRGRSIKRDAEKDAAASAAADAAGLRLVETHRVVGRENGGPSLPAWVTRDKYLRLYEKVPATL